MKPIKEKVVYVIHGDPIALQRARKGRHSVYDSQKIEKLAIGINVRNQHDDRPLYQGPLQLDVTFYMPVAKSRERFRDSLMGTYHFYAPDTSNMIKFLEDVANGILYRDDCSIAKINATKIYGEPRTEFTITELK